MVKKPNKKPKLNLTSTDDSAHEKIKKDPPNNKRKHSFLETTPFAAHSKINILSRKQCPSDSPQSILNSYVVGNNENSRIQRASKFANSSFHYLTTKTCDVVLMKNKKNNIISSSNIGNKIRNSFRKRNGNDKNFKKIKDFDDQNNNLKCFKSFRERKTSSVVLSNKKCFKNMNTNCCHQSITSKSSSPSPSLLSYDFFGIWLKQLLNQKKDSLFGRSMDRDLRRTLNIELKYREGLIKIISACHGTNRIQYYEACMGLFVSNIRINSFKLALDKKTAIISVEKNTVESAAPIPKTEGTTDIGGTYYFDSEDTRVVKMRKTKQRVYLSNLDVTENTTNEDMMMYDKEDTTRNIIVVNNEKTMAAVVKREPSSSNSASVITDDSGVSSGEGLITNEFIGAPIGSGSTNHIRGRREPNSPSQSNSSTTGNNSPLAFEELVELPNGNKKRKDNNNVHRFLKKEPVILPESFYFGMSTMTDHHHPDDASATFSNTKLLHNKKFGFRLGDLTSSSHRHNSTGSSSCKSSKIIHDDSNGIKLLATRDYDSNYRIPIPDYDDWDDELPNVNNIIPKKNKENANLNISSGKETTSTKFIYPKYSDVKSFLNPKFTETDEMQVFSTTTCSSTSSYIASKLKDQYRDICEESCTKKVKDVMGNKNKTKYYYQGYRSKFSSNNITGTKLRHTVMAIDDEILEALKVNAILHDMTIVKPIHASPLDESHFDSKRNMVSTFSPFEPTINDSEYEKSYHNPLSMVSSFSSVRDSCCPHPEFAAKNICQDSYLLVNVTLSELRIPLIWDEKEHFKASNRNSTNRFSRFSFSHNTQNIKIQSAQGASGGDGWFVFAMATCGTQILHSSLVNGIDPSLTDITFDKDIFTFQKLKPDFVINLQFYGTSSKLIKKSNETVAQSPFMNLIRGKIDRSVKGDDSIHINEFQSYRSKPIGHSFSFNTLLDNFNTTEGTDLNALSQNEFLDQIKIKQHPSVFAKKPSSDSRTNSRRSFFEHLKPKNNCISKDDIVEWKSYLRSSAKKVKTSETPPNDGVEKKVMTGHEVIDQIIFNPGNYKLIASCHLRANHIHESLQVGDLNIIPIRNSSSSSTLPIMGHFSFKLSNL